MTTIDEHLALLQANLDAHAQMKKLYPDAERSDGQPYFVSASGTAALGAQQFSGMLVLTGQGWDTTAGASKPLDFCSQVEPAQTAGNPTGVYRIYVRQNNGAWSSVMRLSSSGALDNLSTITTSAGITAQTGGISASTGAITSFRVMTTTNQDGFATGPTLVADVSATVRQSPDFRQFAYAWNSVGAVSEQHDWRWFILPATAAGTTTSQLLFQSQIAGGGYVTRGGFVTTGTFFCNANIQSNSGTIISIRSGLATSNGTAFQANNSTASTAGTPVQQSPDYYYLSSAYNSVSGLSESHEWRHFILPATAAGTTTSTWKLQRQIASGGYADMAALASSGTMTLTGSLIANGNSVTATGAGGLVATAAGVTAAGTVTTTAGYVTTASSGAALTMSGQSPNIVTRVRISPARVSSAGTGAQQIGTIPVTNGTARRMRGTIVGVKSDGSVSYSYVFVATATASAGVAAVNATVTADAGSATTTTAPTVTASAGNVVFTSGDTAATTIRWTVSFIEDLELTAA